MGSVFSEFLLAAIQFDQIIAEVGRAISKFFKVLFGLLEIQMSWEQ
jgi:hypothetical protein